MTTLNLQVAAGGDDGIYGISPTSYFGTGDTNAVAGNIGGGPYGSWFRFTGVSGLSGATITTAVLQLYGNGADNGTPLTKIRAERAAAPANPSNQADAEGRTKTTAKADWDSPGLSTSGYTSKDITSVIQELADNHDPSEIILYWEDDGSASGGWAQARSKNHSDGTFAAKLDITYATSVTATPDLAALASTKYAPTVSVSNNQLVTPDALALLDTQYAPVPAVSDHQIATPGVLAHSLTPYAPVPAISDNQMATPGLAELLTALFAPAIIVDANQLVTPDVLAMLATAYAPLVTPSDHQLFTPDVLALAMSLLAPVVTPSDFQLATPDTLALALAAFVPVLTITENQLLTPDLLALLTAGQIPIASIGQFYIPDALALALSLLAPDITIAVNQLVTPDPLALALATYAISVLFSHRKRGMDGGMVSQSPIMPGGFPRRIQ